MKIKIFAAFILGLIVAFSTAYIIHPISCGFFEILPCWSGNLGGYPLKFINYTELGAVPPLSFWNYRILRFIFDWVIWSIPFILLPIFADSLISKNSKNSYWIFNGLLVAPIVLYLLPNLLNVLGIQSYLLGLGSVLHFIVASQIAGIVQTENTFEKAVFTVTLFYSLLVPWTLIAQLSLKKNLKRESTLLISFLTMLGISLMLSLIPFSNKPTPSDEMFELVSLNAAKKGEGLNLVEVKYQFKVQKLPKENTVYSVQSFLVDKNGGDIDHNFISDSRLNYIKQINGQTYDMDEGSYLYQDKFHPDDILEAYHIVDKNTPVASIIIIVTEHQTKNEGGLNLNPSKSYIYPVTMPE